MRIELKKKKKSVQETVLRSLPLESVFISLGRDRKNADLEFPATAQCFGHTLLQRLLSYTEEAQEHMSELGNTFSLPNTM